MTAEERKKFRRSKEWKELRARIRLKVSRDYITKAPLSKSWNLHHLDMRPDHYTDISNMKKFVPLNMRTHTAVHIIYNEWHKDKIFYNVMMHTFCHSDYSGYDKQVYEAVKYMHECYKKDMTVVKRLLNILRRMEHYDKSCT